MLEVDSPLQESGVEERAPLFDVGTGWRPDLDSDLSLVCMDDDAATREGPSAQLETHRSTSPIAGPSHLVHELGEQ